MGLGRRQYRAIGPTGGGSYGSIDQMQLQLNGGYLGEYGGSQANLWVYRGALRIPAVWKATMLVAELLAQVEWDAFSEHGRAQAEKLAKPPLLDQPCPPDTQFTVFRSGMIDYIHDGNAIWIVASRNPLGVPTSVLPVPASWVGVRRITPENEDTTMLPIGAIEYQVGSHTFSSDDVIHFKGPCAPGALRGGGVLELFLTGTFETAHEQEREALKMSRHGVPAGILKFLNDNVPAKPDKDGNVPTMKQRMQTAADSWLSARDHSGVAVMNSAVDFTPLAWKPDDMQMIEARQFTLVQLSNIMRVPPKFVGATVAGSSLDYATSETGGKELLRDTMGGYFKQWEQTISLVLPRGTTAKANLDEFLKSDMVQRFQAYASGIDAGFIMPNHDVRRWENLDDQPQLDQAPTAAAAKQQNKGLSIEDIGLKQAVEGDIGGVLGKGLSTSGKVVQSPTENTAGQLVPVPASQQQSSGPLKVRAIRLPDPPPKMIERA
jgi:HK97 family phage portal protein